VAGTSACRIPGDGTAHSAMGFSCVLGGRYQEAVRHYREQSTVTDTMHGATNGWLGLQQGRSSP